MVRNRKHRASRSAIRLDYGSSRHGERGSPPGYEKLFTFRKPQYPDWVFSGTFDDLPDVDVGLGPFHDIEAYGTWAFDHDLPDSSHHTNTVST